jgi:hypothetical protein
MVANYDVVGVQSIEAASCPIPRIDTWVMPFSQVNREVALSAVDSSGVQGTWQRVRRAAAPLDLGSS